MKNKFFKIVFFIFIITQSFVFAQNQKTSGVKEDDKKVKYFSPNSDGVLDEFVIPLKIADKRYITSWNLIITDEAGTTVRTIGNKVALPSKLNFKTFFKQLGSAKTGVDIPDVITWNGAMDNGETAPDGKYNYRLEAFDDNGNKGKSDEYTVIIDTVSPIISLTQPKDKIFGEGAKSELKISQTGSIEDKWYGRIKNSSGEIVKTITWENSEPRDFKWNGTDGNGQTVADGIYSYDISATDRAGNVSEPAVISSIIYSAEKPVINIFLLGSQYFSPGTESRLSNIKLQVSIPSPDEKSVNRLTSWSVKIQDAKGKVYKNYDQSISAVPPAQIVFDGTGDDGKLIPQGKYVAIASAAYLNGYVPTAVKSPEFILDVTKPSAILSVSDKIFGAGSKTEVKITMLPDAAGKYASVPSWTARIYDVENPDVSVRSYDFGEYPPDFINWNGFSSNGKLAPDGKYKFEIRAVDLAGNVGIISTEDAFELDTKAAQVLLTADLAAFNPTATKTKNSVTFTPVLKDVDGISEYTFNVLNSQNTPIKTIKGSSSLPKTFVWDGKDETGIICADGSYVAKLAVVSVNGSPAEVSTSPFVIDTGVPNVEASVPWTDFSPDGDSIQDTIPVAITNCTEEALWKADISNSSGTVIKSYTWKGKITTNGKDGFEWDGSDSTGNRAKDGVYSITISSTDEAENSFSTKIAGLNLDSRETKAYLTVEYDAFSPNGDSILDTQVFNIKTTVQDGILTWNFDIKDESENVVRAWSEKDSANLPASITWDGLDSSGNPGEGTYTGTLNISYKKGNKVNVVSSPFVCTVTAPILSVTTAPKYFSPDNDGDNDDLFIRLSGTSKVPFKSWSFEINDPNGKLFWSTKGTSSITERIIWDGLSNVQKTSKGKAERVQSAMDYPYIFTVTDTLGMTSVVKDAIFVDVLVIREGDLLKMAVPAIIFRSDNADFGVQELDKDGKVIKSGITKEQAENNERVLKRIAEVLNKFKDYKVTIQGHANRVTDNEDEETVDNMRMWGPALIPLSAKRAEFVKDYLVKKGVSASRLSTEGKGGTELVADYKDKDNNWKNRRVEFILVK